MHSTRKTKQTLLSGDYQPLNSSVLRAIAYDEYQHTLRVKFTSGSEYIYFDVPKAYYEGLITAPSSGQFFDDKIRNAGFDYRRFH